MVCAILASGGAAHETAAAAQTTGVKGTAQEVVKNGLNADRTIYYRNWKKYTGQRKIAGKYYLFKNGRLQKGFRTIQVNGKKLRVYYSRKTGEMLFGAQTIKGEKYYFNKRTGAMKTGWRKSGGKNITMTKTSGWSQVII